MNFSLEFPIFNPSEAPVKRQNDPLLSSIDTIPCILMNHPFSYETWPTQRCQPQLDLQNLCCCSYLCLGVENWKWKKRWRRRRKMSGRHYCNQCCQLWKELNFESICLVSFDFGMESTRYRHLRYEAIRYGNLGTKQESTK